jgi:glycosyltransferase involved in cell wall biosynthesis
MSRPAKLPKLLHISPILPRTSGNGLAMRASCFSEALAQIGPLTVAALAAAGSPTAHSADRTVRLSASGQSDTMLSLISNMPPSQDRIAKLLSNGMPPGTIAWSLPIVEQLKRVLEAQRWGAICLTRADLLVLQTRYNLFPAGIPLIVDLDDDDSAYHRQLANAASSADPLRADWYRAIGRIYESLIIKAAPSVSLFTCASEIGASTLGRLTGTKKIAVVANAVGKVEGARFRPEARSILFVGNLSYQPNIDGLFWVLQDVWPKLRASEPGLRLEIAGSNPSRELRGQCQLVGAQLHANPSSLNPLYQRAGVAIVPLRFGSGSRIKILEAGVHRVPVVSTTLGADGLGLDPTHDYFCADTASEFVGQCRLALAQRSLSMQRATSLANQIKSRFDREVRVAELRAAIYDAIPTLKQA